MVEARVPHAWKDQIEGICRETGKCGSEIVQAAIAEYLGRTDLNSVESMILRLAALEWQLKKLVSVALSGC